MLERELPRSGLVLEIASGTGQHVAHFAKSLPQLSWQPSDPDADFRRSISLWIDFEHLANVKEPLALDVREQPWPIASADAIVCINMLHVAPWEAAQALFEGARQLLSQQNLLFLYGPYRRKPAATRLRAMRSSMPNFAHTMPSGGCATWKRSPRSPNHNGFALADTFAMPANNFSLVFRKRDAAAG